MRFLTTGFLGAIILFVVSGFLIVHQYQKPLPALAITQLAPQTATPLAPKVALPWPRTGSAAVGIDRLGVVDTIRDDKPRPIASVTKIMTAYLILKNHPLQAGAKGPIVRVTAADVKTYQQQDANDESTVRVTEGEMISQYDLLQGVLIASGNNLAYMLATWDGGTMDAFVQKMNAQAAMLGMTNTRYADPSGVSAKSMSTARDQVILAQAAMANPVFAEIVAKVQAEVPVAGTIYNVNTILGHKSIVGVKTGWTEEAGGCFVFAANVQVDGRTLMAYGAVLGQDTLTEAFNATETLIPALATAPHFTKVMAPGSPAVQVTSRWGRTIQALTDGDSELLLWPGTTVRQDVNVTSISVPIKQDADLGMITFSAGTMSQAVHLKAAESLPRPSRLWRITRR